MQDAKAGAKAMQDAKAGAKGMKDAKSDTEDEVEMDDEGMAEDKLSDDGTLGADEAMADQDHDADDDQQEHDESEDESGREIEGEGGGELEGDVVVSSQVDIAPPKKRSASAKWGKGWVEVPSELPLNTSVSSIMGRGQRQKKPRPSGSDSN